MFCVNCGKELEESWVICPYCGDSVPDELRVGAENVHPEMEVTTQEMNIPVSQEKNTGMLTVENSFLDENGKGIWGWLNIFLNRPEGVEGYLKLFDAIAGFNDFVATKKINHELMSIALSRLANVGIREDDVLVYMDDGIFNKGKKGLLLTCSRMYFLTKKDIKMLKYDEINVLNKSGPGKLFYFNLIFEMPISWGGDAELALALALIFSMTYQQVGNSKKILLTKN